MMSTPTQKKTPAEQQPPGHRDRDTAEDRPHKRGEYVAGADGDRDVDASAADDENADDAEAERSDKDGTGW